MVNWNPQLWSEPMQRGTIWRPRLVPKAFWRRVAWVKNVYLYGYCGGMLVLVVLTGRRLALIGGAVAFGALLVWGLAPRIAKRRMLRELQSGDYCLCLDCGYCLKGLPAQHTCPECATAFDMEKVQNAWRHWERFSRLPEEMVQSEAKTG